MPHIPNVFGFESLGGQILSGHGPISREAITTFSLPLINIPVPGDTDLGGFGGLITEILQRFPIPRPRLPLPRGPSTPGPRGRIPIPIPIPLGGGLFSGNGCPEGQVNPCCRGEHLDKATGSRCVSNRRMNFGNTRALKRAIRRAKGFERLVKSNRKSLRSLAKI